MYVCYCVNAVVSVLPVISLITVHFDTGQASSLSLPAGQVRHQPMEVLRKVMKKKENKLKESAQRPVRPPVCVDILT